MPQTPTKLSNLEDLPKHHIEGAGLKHSIDGSKRLRVKTKAATFVLRPIIGKEQTFLVQVTSQFLPGLFKWSGHSSFGWFTVARHPGRNSVSRPKVLQPLQGNGVLMWPLIPPEEKQRAVEFLEKLLRQEIPKMPLPPPK